MKIKQYCYFKDALLQKFNSDIYAFNGGEDHFKIIYVEAYPGIYFNLNGEEIQVGDSGVYYLDLNNFNKSISSFSFTYEGKNETIFDSIEEAYFVATFYSDYKDEITTTKLRTNSITIPQKNKKITITLLENE